MLFSRSFLILFLLSTVLLFTYAPSYRDEEASYSGEQDFDVIVFSQHWPETFCYQWKERNPFNKCQLPKRKEWTIHGIWPTKFQTQGPSFCNNSLPFDESALSPILHQLDEKWMNIKGGKPRFEFWKYEWEKHGTCATVLTDLNTQLKYFQKGLDLLNQYDMTRILAKANILPGQNYSIQEIIDGVQKILGKTVQIQCYKNPLSML